MEVIFGIISVKGYNKAIKLLHYTDWGINRMIQLIPYTSESKNDILKWITDFYQFHNFLLNKEIVLTESDYTQSEETLKKWLQPSHELYLIKFEQLIVGFLHIGYRGENVAWIEDIYVDRNYRNKGIATQSILLAEEVIKSHSGYTSVCLDVVPRNITALNLYYKLGYDSLSMVTIRKELYENQRDKTGKVLGFNFKY